MTSAASLGKSEQKKPLISVCIVTYNQQAYIRDSVMSAIAQSTPLVFDLEILIGDDGSTDATPKILQHLANQYPEIVTVITNKPNIGASENYKMLIRRARGEFIAHLDGDDYWLPGKLLAQLFYLKHHSHCIAVYTGAMVIDTERHLLGSFTSDQPVGFGVDRLLSEGNFLCHSTMLYRASKVQSVLNLPSPFIDFEIHLTLATGHMLGFINQQLAIYRSMVPGSFTKDRQGQVDKLYFLTLKKHLPSAVRSTHAQAIAHYAVNMAAAYPRIIFENVFWTDIADLKKNSDTSYYAVLVFAFRSFQRLLKRKLSRAAANLLNFRERFIIFYPTK